MRAPFSLTMVTSARAAASFLQHDVSDRLRNGIAKLIMDQVYPSSTAHVCHFDGTYEDVGET